MPLVDLDLPFAPAELPGDVRAFLREAERRIEHFQRDSRVPAFVPSDFVTSYHLLRTLSESALVPGSLFCEWGSGFGVVACLAALLEFDAYGIEIEGELVQEARRLATDFDLPVEFIHGSFIPRGGERSVGGDHFAWLTTDAGSAEEQLGLAADDFSVIFAYPWPDEEELTADLFERHAAAGAILVTYHSDDFRLRRKKLHRCHR